MASGFLLLKNDDSESSTANSDHNLAWILAPHRSQRARTATRRCAESSVRLVASRIAPPDPSLTDLLSEIAHNLSSLDGRVFRSIRRLLFSPGFLTKEYVEGRRATWLPPIRVYLVISVIYFSISSLIGESGARVDIRVTGDTDEETLIELRCLGFSSEDELELAVTDAEATWMPRPMFVLMPIFAALVQAVQRRSRHRYPHHFIFSLHVNSAWFSIFSASAVIGYLLGNDSGRTFVGIVALVCALAYLAIALARAYGVTRRRAIAQSLVISAIYGFVTILITTAIVVPMALAGRS